MNETRNSSISDFILEIIGHLFYAPINVDSLWDTLLNKSNNIKLVSGELFETTGVKITFIICNNQRLLNFFTNPIQGGHAISDVACWWKCYININITVESVAFWKRNRVARNYTTDWEPWACWEQLCLRELVTICVFGSSNHSLNKWDGDFFRTHRYNNLNLWGIHKCK